MWDACNPDASSADKKDARAVAAEALDGIEARPMTETSWAVRVFGTPAPQGSKKHVGNGVMVESSKAVKPWREKVAKACTTEILRDPSFTPFDGPVAVRIVFYLARPGYHFGTGRNRHVLKDGVPRYVATRPDIEKLVRSTHDALTTAGVWMDDSLAVKLETVKLYDEHPGAGIRITSVAP